MVFTLQHGTGMRRVPDRGLTILELMVVVAIVGVLVAVAIVAYTKNVRKAKSSEVSQIFAELKTREEAYHAEFGTYLSTDDEGEDGEGWFPDSLSGDELTDISSATPPTGWTTLRVQPGKGGLYCQYKAVGGAGGDNTGMGAWGTDMFGGTPARNWFYSLARCDWDGSGDEFSEYGQRGDMTALIRENEWN